MLFYDWKKMFEAAEGSPLALFVIFRMLVTGAIPINKYIYKNVRREVKHKYFIRLFNYLERLDIDSIKDDTYTVGDSYDISNLIMRLDDLRIHFERYEEYERCGLIKSTIDMLFVESTKNKTLNELSI